jgi:UDP-N-acetylmuramyl pentapeptide phosphotransferase/UDP-N-acetylglucosamine-1-phosphate transferase
MEAGATAHLFAPILAGIVSIAVMVLLLKNRNLATDEPNERSLHSISVPRTGGMAIVAGTLASALLLSADLAIVGLAAVLAVVSYADDRHQLPALARLAVHLCAASVLVAWGGLPQNMVIAVGLVLAVSWLTNLYNFMDGADGLAGGMAVIGFSSYAIAAWMSGMPELGLLAFSIAASAAGFLIFNFPPARIFMGDVGSIPLGFLAGAIGVAGWQRGAWPLWFPVVVFAPFIVDASVTLARRVLRGERVWQAHRQHYYQRLVLSGWSHRNTALFEYALMLICGAAAILCLNTSSAMRSVVLSLLAAIFAVAIWAIDRRWRQFSADAND